MYSVDKLILPHYSGWLLTPSLFPQALQNAWVGLRLLSPSKFILDTHWNKRLPVNEQSARNVIYPYLAHCTHHSNPKWWPKSIVILITTTPPPNSSFNVILLTVPPDRCFSLHQYSSPHYIQFELQLPGLLSSLFLFSPLFLFSILTTQTFVFSHKNNCSGLAKCVKRRVTPQGSALHTCLQYFMLP